MTEQDSDPGDHGMMLIGLCAAALSGAFVGVVCGAIGAVLAMLTWRGY